MSVLQERTAGVLLAVSSLPSPYGIGTFGAAAREWLHFLHDAKQRCWQILPLGPTGWGDSPYMSFSAFAISPYYIDLDLLKENGLIVQEELNMDWGGNPCRVDYAALFKSREKVLRRAFERFSANVNEKDARNFEAFCTKNKDWLSDYALFMAIKSEQGGRSWLSWEEPLRFRREEALNRFCAENNDSIKYYSFVQYLAFTQWHNIKDYAASLGVAVVGDMPIYVAMDSADTWAHNELFQLDEKRHPLRVAGCPPDPFAAGGQLWGNPLYRWDYHEKTGFAWWISRLRASLAIYDIVRIDHFRGFESYYSIDAGAEDARGGEWVKGPGLAFINAINAALPGAEIIAEDLGFLTEGVRALLAASGYPGMKILQFAFDSREASGYMPYTYGRHSVVYTGTHDNDTAQGWFSSANPEDIALAREYFGFDNDGSNDKEGSWAFVRAALGSVANLAIIPAQDYLGLGSEARMNTPSTTGGSNWQWRLPQDAALPALAARIKSLTKIMGR